MLTLKYGVKISTRMHNSHLYSITTRTGTSVSEEEIIAGVERVSEKRNGKTRLHAVSRSQNHVRILTQYA